MIMLIPHFFETHPNDLIQIKLKLGQSFCKYNRIRGRKIYRHFFRGSTSISGTRTKFWWRNNIYGGIYWLTPSDCIDLNLIAIPNEPIDIGHFNRSLKYRLAAITSYKPILNVIRTTDLVFPDKYFSFGQLYLLESKTKNERQAASCS
jgi:hypothetical protein